MTDDTTSTLPKPITMTGSAFDDKTKKEEKVEKQKEVIEEVDDDEKETDELPMPVVFGDDDDSNNTSSSVSTHDEIEDEEKPLEIEVPVTPDNENDLKDSAKTVESKISLSPKIEKEKTEEEIPELILNDDSNAEETVFQKAEEATPQIPVSKFSHYDDEPEEKVEEKIESLPIINSELKEEIEPEKEVESASTDSNNNIDEEESSFEIPKLDNSVNLESRKNDVANDVKVIEGQQPGFRPPTASVGIPNNQPYYSQPSAPVSTDYSSAMQRQMQPVNNYEEEKTGGVPRVILGILGVFIGGGLVVGGYFTANKIFNKGEEQIAQQAVSEPVPVPTQVPVTPTPVVQTPQPAEKDTIEDTKTNEDESLEETVDDTTKKEDLTIRILNGNGEKGVAKVVRTLLVEEGFADVKTGNAENFDYKKSYISYKPEYEDFVDEITTILEDKYTLIKDEELESSDDYDFYIILGPEEEAKTE